MTDKSKLTHPFHPSSEFGYLALVFMALFLICVLQPLGLRAANKQKQLSIVEIELFEGKFLPNSTAESWPLRTAAAPESGQFKQVRHNVIYGDVFLDEGSKPYQK